MNSINHMYILLLLAGIEEGLTCCTLFLENHVGEGENLIITVHHRLEKYMKHETAVTIYTLLAHNVIKCGWKTYKSTVPVKSDIFNGFMGQSF